MDPGRRPPTRWVLAATLIYVVVVLAVALARPRPLGHDESMYAIGARMIWSDDASLELGAHRSVGMPLLSAPGVAAGGDELAIRLPFAFLALGFLVVVYRTARAREGAAAAALAVAVVVTNPTWLRGAAEALSDLPAAMLLLAMAGLCAGDGSPARPRRAVAAGVAAAAACYVRYGSAAAVIAIYGATAIAAATATATATGIDERGRWRWLAISGAAAGACLLPLALYSLERTGSPIGVFLAGERAAQRAHLGDGLGFYLRSWPVLLAGPIGGVLAAIGVVVGLRAWRPGPDGATPRDRFRRLLATAAVGQVVMLGVLVHGEARFVMFAVTALVVVGAGWVAERARRWWLAVGLVAATALPSAAWALLHLDHLRGERVDLIAATEVMRRDAGGRRCLAFATEAPITTWYSGCRTIQVDGWGLDPARAVGAERVYLVEARGLPRSIGGVEAATREALGWRPLVCDERFCVWRATRAGG